MHLTYTDMRVLEVILAIAKRGPVTSTAIQSRMHWRSRGSALRHVQRLETAGLIAMERNERNRIMGGTIRPMCRYIAEADLGHDIGGEG